MTEYVTPGLDGLSFNLNFPTTHQDGRQVELVWGPLQYNSGGLATRHSSDFIHKQDFDRAYQYGIACDHPHHGNQDLHLEWITHIGCWLATQAMRLEGDFVECGVRTGFMSRCIMKYLNFERRAERKFYLLDTFAAIPDDQFLDEEIRRGSKESYADYAEDCYEQAVENFRDFPNAILIRGAVPGTLEQVNAENVCFLHIDMNIVLPEIAAARFFWDKLVPGAFVLLDDYGWLGHDIQRVAFDEFAKERGVDILSLPTGQGLIMKPPAAAG